jgi:hypothetical protein
MACKLPGFHRCRPAWASGKGQMTQDQEKNENGKQKKELDDNWENCKGQCGYTPWCRTCKTPETLPEK